MRTAWGTSAWGRSIDAQYHPGDAEGARLFPPRVSRHTLFDGFRDHQPVIMESHDWQIKTLPELFDLLASTDWCRVQVMQHRDIPVFGIQGHPEAYTAEYPDGKRFIRNFAAAAGILKLAENSFKAVPCRRGRKARTRRCRLNLIY